jgi:ornithine carbamoyltransferase
MRDLISLAELTPTDMEHILDVAVDLKREFLAGGNKPILAGKALGMIFQKQSLRTRVSFEMAMQHLGGHALYIAPDEIGLGKRETVPDVARVLSRFVDIIMARVYEHSIIEQLAAYSRVPVINGLSDYTHPCQALADLLTIQEKKGKLKGITLAYVGDGNNVAASLAFACALTGMHFVCVTPQKYELPVEVVQKARKLAEKTSATIRVTYDLADGFRNADAVYTDVWTSMGQEAEKEQRMRVFPPYQLNAAALRLAKPDAIVLHCLPAHRGEEISDDVIESPQSVVFDEAENRLHAQKAVIAILMGKK